MKKLLLVDSDKESSFVLSKQLEFDKKYVVHQAIGYQELQELKEEKDNRYHFNKYSKKPA